MLLLTWPILLFIVFSKKKYRRNTLSRLGLTLTKELKGVKADKKVFWVHALSVGETTSALPLVRGLRERYPDTAIVFSVSTSSGLNIARSIITPHVDCVISGPLDFLPSLFLYLKQIRPSVFFLIETDFWPNWLLTLRYSGAAMVLANGRISAASLEKYKNFSFFFKPLFNCFDLLAMQTAKDVVNLGSLGIASDKIITLGNLKYDALMADTPVSAISRKELGIITDKPIWICGSTHSREEAIIFDAFARLQNEKPLLLLAPRDIKRGAELIGLAEKMGFHTRLRSSDASETGDENVLVLDTLGELSRCYSLASVAFIGGSLVAQGGHNPLEAAVYGVPTLFGPHMEDFQEIADDLIQNAASVTVTEAEDMAVLLDELLLPGSTRHRVMAGNAKSLVQKNQGVVEQHLQAIEDLISR